jgi:hypothetical protein
VTFRSSWIACVALLAGCLGWQGGTGKNAISPPGIGMHDSPPPPRATLVGTLWPPSGEPAFAVSGRRIVIELDGEPSIDAETDRRGRFEARLSKAGRYSVRLVSDAADAVAPVSITDLGATVRVDLLAHRRLAGAR